MAGRIQTVAKQGLVTALGLGAEVVAQAQVDGLRGHVRRIEAGEQPQIHFRMLTMKVPKARQQPVPGERRGGVDYQLIGLAVLLQAPDANRQLLQHRLGGALQVVTGVGQADAAAVAKEQRLLEESLQAADLLADRRLGQVQLFGGFMKAAQARGSFKAAQGIQGRPVL
ncbi:hypothetical protein D9M71_509390 [compost metagenome]